MRLESEMAQIKRKRVNKRMREIQRDEGAFFVFHLYHYQSRDLLRNLYLIKIKFFKNLYNLKK